MQWRQLYRVLVWTHAHSGEFDGLVGVNIGSSPAPNNPCLPYKAHRPLPGPVERMALSPQLLSSGLLAGLVLVGLLPSGSTGAALNCEEMQVERQ